MRKVSIILVFFSMFIGILLTIWGLTHLQWPQALPWEPYALRRYILTLFAFASLVFVGSWWSKRSALFIGAIIAASIALLCGVLWPLVVTLWFVAASALLGGFILAGIGLERGRWLTSFLVGAGVYGTAVGLAAHFAVNYPGVYGVALALPIVFGWRAAVDDIKGFFVNNNRALNFRISLLDVAIAAIALIYFIVALMPELGYDSLVMHLFLPVHLALNHQWGFDASTYAWAVMPMLGDFIFSIGYMFAGETAARLINISFIFVLCWLVRDLVFWARGSEKGARWAVLIFLSTPLTFTEGSSLFIESIWASFVVSGTLSILRACSNLSERNFELPVAGLLLGCALAAKAVTFTILPILFLLLIFRYRTWYKSTGLPRIFFSFCLFLTMGLIPYVTAWQLTGNPVFPIFNHIFRSIYFPFGKELFGAAIFNQGMRWDTLYQVTFQSEKYLEAIPGVSGFQWLLLFLPASILLLTIRHWRTIVLLVMGAVWIVVTFHSTSYLRYVFPAWVILTATIGIALDTVPFKYIMARYIGYIVTSVAIGLNLLFLNSGGFYGDFALKSVTDITSSNLYLDGRLPIRNAVKLVNHLNIGRSPVAVFAEPKTAGLFGDALNPSWYNVKFQGEIATIHTEQDLTNILKKRGVVFIILDSTWNGSNCCSEGAEKQNLIEKISEVVADYGTLSVRKIKASYYFNTELLMNPDFTFIQGWSLAPGAKYDSETRVIRTNVISPATQVVGVFPGVQYQNLVVARYVKEPTMGRVQINWLDKTGQFISTNIKTFVCSSRFTNYTMNVTAPPHAANAVVYASGHTEAFIEFKRNSLTQ